MSPSTAVLLLAFVLAAGHDRCNAAETCAASEMTDGEFEAELRGVKCGLYSAPSTIRDAGYGVYTAVDMPQVGMSTGPEVPLLVVFNTAVDQPWKEYHSDPQPYYAEYEGNKEMNASILAMGLTMLSNSHPGLVNIVPREPTFYASLDPRLDPGAGAFSDYRGTFRNTKVLSAGDELFLDYGGAWFESRGIDGDAGTPVAAAGTAASAAHRRSVEWLEENGSCIDHVYVRESTVPQAGRGAFARRPVRAGDVVISDRLLPTRGGRGEFRRRTDRGGAHASPSPADRQQLVNYLYSHPDSSLLFLPTGVAGMINHRTGGREGGPNVEMRWSTDERTRHFLNVPPEKFPMKGTVVVLDFVATRDIAVDEEIFVDYGRRWQDAWDRHVAHWVPPKGAAVTSAEVSAMNDNKFYRSNWKWSDAHFTTCLDLEYLATQGVEMADGQAVSLEDDFVAKSLGIDGRHIGFELLGFGSKRMPCVVLGADEDAGTMGVMYFLEEDGERFMGYVEDLPSSFLMFVSLPNSSDQHRDDGHRFTQEVEIPHFPEVWKNLLLSGDP